MAIIINLTGVIQLWSLLIMLILLVIGTSNYVKGHKDDVTMLIFHKSSSDGALVR